MTRHVKTPVFLFITVFLSAIMLSGCIIHVGASTAKADYQIGDDYSTVNKSLTIDEGKTVGDVSAVNGTLTVKDNVSAEDISGVNGSVSIGKNVFAESASTVNGRLRAQSNFVVAENVSSVNGGIFLNPNSTVGGKLETVNGQIDLDGVHVKKDIVSVSGNIHLSGNTHVEGDIVYQWNKGNSNYNNRLPLLKISESVKLDGNIILERPVDLVLKDESLNSKVIRNY